MPFSSYKSQSALALMVWMVGLVYSMESVLSISMGVLLGLALFEWRGSGLHFRQGFRCTLSDFRRSGVWLAVCIPFLLVLFSAPYATEDTPYLLGRLRIKVPYVALPFAFFSLPRFSQREYHHLFYFFLAVVSVSAVGVLAYYVRHFEAVNMAISKGQPMPTPAYHIRYSLMVALAILSAMVLFATGHYWKYRAERWLILGMGVFLLVFIHILSVRSGLVVMYASAGLLLAGYIFHSRKYLLGLALGAMMFVLPIAAYHTLPSLQSRIGYMLWDMKMQARGDGEDYSDSERIQSYQMAFAIIREHPLFGVGAGDLRHQMHLQYQQQLPDLPEPSRKMPHNQYLSVLAGTGMMGLLLFLLGGFYPLLAERHFTEPFFLVIHLIVALSFLVENTMETAVGVAFHSLFLLWGMAYWRKHDAIYSGEPSPNVKIRQKNNSE